MSNISKTQRVWTKVDKRFLTLRTEFVSNDTVVIYERNGKALYYEPSSTYSFEDLVLQWGSGVNDSKGNEILEGDIVRIIPDGNIYKSYYGEIIVSTKDCFMIKTEQGNIEPLIDSKNLEIIGNIFQLPCNPDHNGECLVCDAWLSDCPFLNKEKNKD
jgi:uncharacterized phage protein (TIGR01671 family)